MFGFGVQMNQLFQVDVTTELHGFMRHVENHLIHLDCLRRGSWEGKEVVNRQLQVQYSSTNKHLDPISPQKLKT